MKAENLDFIQRYLDKELNEDELSLFKKRVAEDADFAGDVREFTGMIIGIREATKTEKNKNVVLKFITPFAIAASVLLFISVGYYFYVRNENKSLQKAASEKGKDIIAVKDTISTGKAGQSKKISKTADSFKINYLADNYKSNPTIDELIKQNYRSGDNQIHIKAPKDSTYVKVNTKIKFVVEPFSNMPYKIIVYDNDFNLKYESVMLQKNINELDIPLPLGLFYWKVKCPKQLMWGGRLYVVK